MSDTIVHSKAFRYRRFLNWFPLGITYALLYMGRYNLTVSKNALGDLMTKADFGEIFGLGAVVYAFSFLINGPLVDRIGGKKGILIGVLGSVIANFGMGLYLRHVLSLDNPAEAPLKYVYFFLFSMNMYFQSYGAVSIVKVNANWFHVSERGTFSGIFGTMIAWGIYLAFDVNGKVLDSFIVVGQGFDHGPALWWVFWTPATLLTLFWIVQFFLLQDTPSKAGLEDFDTADASSGEDLEAKIPTKELFIRILTNPVIMTIAAIEFCTGVLRNGVMQWFLIYAKEQIDAGGDITSWSYAHANWGLTLAIAGSVGGMVAGIVSDKVFQSRRAPSAGFLYAILTFCLVGVIFSLTNGWLLAFLMFTISICVIGTHGLLSGTATMDFGGRKGAATAVGIIDGFVYLGTGVQSFALGYLTTKSWSYWPLFLIPFGIIGFILLLRIWNAKPGAKSAGH